ncbi:hypothetical protein [uncultured Prevotella sp.]|uniref:hypothetical protein n=1 Tax=uncultured Prevotella sp. TaxID=159272 RepID=UPI0025FADE1E|nr:hypothetical protein [uncultured Prevotella sp.]
MKKLVFAAVAALALVSVSNVFAGQNNDNEKVQNTVVSDTTVTTPAPADTVATAE